MDNQLQKEFEQCRAALNSRAVELHWDNLHQDDQAVALFQEEVRLARAANDSDMYMQCYKDTGEFGYCSQNSDYNKLEWELLHKAAELGHMEASRLLADIAFLDGDYDKAVCCVMEHLKRGGEIDDFEDIDLEPAHNCPIDATTLPWMEKVLAVRPRPQCTYVLARCYWDIEDALPLLDEVRLIGSETGQGRAIPLYRQAAEEGYFWSRLYFGLYLLLTGGDEAALGVAYLEKALLHIEEEPESNKFCAENEKPKFGLKTKIETALFKHAGRVSGRILELEERAKQDDLYACIELAMAYMIGKECRRDREKSFEYASRLLFEDHEFGQLLIRMDDLAEDDRKWLNNKLAEEANKIEEECE